MPMDFIVKVQKPSTKWAWSYEVTDTKLANNTKASTLVQIALYSMMVADMQGSIPELMHVVKPDGSEPYRVNNYLSYVKHVKKKFLGEFPKRI